MFLRISKSDTVQELRPSPLLKKIGTFLNPSLSSHNKAEAVTKQTGSKIKFPQLLTQVQETFV